MIIIYNTLLSILKFMIDCFPDFDRFVSKSSNKT